MYVVMAIMLQKSKYVEIRYNTDNIQMLCIKILSYSNVTYHKTHVQSDQSDQKINKSSLSRIGPIPKINKWFLLHTRE